MSKMNVDTFIKNVKKVCSESTCYKLGTFCNKYDSKGRLLTDCSGLIKGVLWGYPLNGKYQSAIKDYNANTLISKCNDVSTDFTKIKKGALVWMSGHIGVYVGNGIVIESTPKWKNGVQKTYCNGSKYTNSSKLNSRKWTKYGYLKSYIDYDSSSSSTDYTKIAKEVIQGKYGNGETRKKKLKELGYSDSEIKAIQQKVNELLK